MEDLPLGRIAALVPEFAVKDLPLGRTLIVMMLIFMILNHYYLVFIINCVKYVRRVPKSYDIERSTIHFEMLLDCRKGIGPGSKIYSNMLLDIEESLVSRFS